MILPSRKVIMQALDTYGIKYGLILIVISGCIFFAQKNFEKPLIIRDSYREVYSSLQVTENTKNIQQDGVIGIDIMEVKTDHELQKQFHIPASSSIVKVKLRITNKSSYPQVLTPSSHIYFRDAAGDISKPFPGIVPLDEELPAPDALQPTQSIEGSLAFISSSYFKPLKLYIDPD